ncbi:MAG: hypothetical protein ACRCXZ_08245 [Patescibacteria group bacterium]
MIRLNRLISFVSILLILTQSIFISYGQEVRQHQLKFTIPKGWSNSFEINPQSKDFKFVNKIQNPSTTELLEVLYTPNEERQTQRLKFYQELKNKNRIIPEDPNILYSIQNNDYRRISVNTAKNTFLNCIKSDYKQLNNNWISVKWIDKVYFIKEKNPIFNYSKKNIKADRSHSLSSLPEVYDFCYQAIYYYVYSEDYSISSKYFDDFYSSHYFSSGSYGSDYIFIRANLTDEYTKSFSTKSVDNNYDNIINSISSSEWEYESDTRTQEQQVTEAYNSIPTTIELHKSCHGGIELKKHNLKTPEIISLKDGQITINSLLQSDIIHYKIWYDLCNNYIFKTETKYQKGELSNLNSRLIVSEKSLNLWDRDTNKIDNPTSNPNVIGINNYSKGLKYYSTNQAYGNPKINLDRYGELEFKIDIKSDPSPLSFEKDHSIGGIFNAVSTGFMQGLYNIPRSVGDSFRYFTSDSRTLDRDIATTAGLVAGGIGIAALAGVSAPVMIPIALGVGALSIGMSLAMDNNGRIQGDIVRNISNNSKSMFCGEGGTEYDSKTDTTEIVDPLYCLGNIGSLGVAAIATSKVESRISTRIKKQINSNYQPSPDYSKYVDKGIIPDESGNIKKLDPNKKTLVNPNAIKPLSVVIDEDLVSIKNAVNKGVTKVDDIEGLSDETRKYLKEFEDAGDDLFGCVEVGDIDFNTHIDIFSIFSLKVNARNTTCSNSKKIIDIVEYEKKNIDLLDTNGVYKNPIDEDLYQQYVSKKVKKGEESRSRLDWKRTRDYFLNDSPMARGNRFNAVVNRKLIYRYFEIVLENKKRLDAYIPGKEIIERKAIDLDMIDESAFKQYLSTFEKKYKRGTLIKTSKDGYDSINNTPLMGEYILEIPESNKYLPDIDKYKDFAKNYNVKLKFTSEY